MLAYPRISFDPYRTDDIRDMREVRLKINRERGSQGGRDAVSESVIVDACLSNERYKRSSKRYGCFMLGADD